MNEVDRKFEEWCPIKILDAAKAPRANELVRAYRNAWRAAYEAGEIAMKEKAAKACDEFDNCEAWNGVFAGAIRALPLSGAEEAKKENV